MADAPSSASTRTTAVIAAPLAALYRAFTAPAALEVWQAPGGMTATVHAFDGRVGGRYRMTLPYPASEERLRGKTAEREDQDGPSGPSGVMCR